MVYKGPSLGCKACRNRHLKCDRTRPACRNCIGAGRTCPGYNDFYDVMWKSQNQIIPEKSERDRLVRARKRHDKTESLNVAAFVPRGVIPGTEAECLTFFWDEWFNMASQSPSESGLPGLLCSLQGKTRLQSALRSAITALAVNVTYSAWRRPLSLEMPCSSFTKALAVTQSALNDPDQRLTDETLVSVLLLGVCDVLIRMSGLQTPSGIHRNGAVALINARGPLNFKSEFSKRLLIAFRHHEIRLALWTGKEVPVDATIRDDLCTESEHPEAALSTFAISIANLKARMGALSIPSVACHIFPPGPLHLLLLRTSPWLSQTLLEQEPLTTSKQEHIDRLRRKVTSAPSLASYSNDAPLPGINANSYSWQSLMADATSLESRLASWPDLVPSSWHYVSESSSLGIAKSIREASLYGDSCDIYPSVDIVGRWDWYRSMRIATIRIIMCCQQMTVPDLGGSHRRPLSKGLIETVQALADQICNSVAFHLGDRNVNIPIRTPEDANYPRMLRPLGQSLNETQYSITDSTIEYKHAAFSYGTWFLLDPLREIMAITSPTSPADIQAIPHRLFLPLCSIRDGQREWLEAQIARIESLNLGDRTRGPVIP